MENFIVSARKYRPGTFDMVVGQDAITATLKNAIKSRHLAQAYLFCGPRGVGKTTCARIFAKTINCSRMTENAEPCNECESCVSFNSLRSLNIHELDAASNNKVEDIRTLTDMVRIPPQTGKYSVYIIDEVHMLSSSAFNAFLKTLEEPPAHAIFILATTEKHKIIPTILSRCQIFDFNRIKTEDIIGRLKYVAEEEKIEYEEEALHVIAVKADGAMRDALSIFDQIVSYSSGRVVYKDVVENLNLLDFEYFFRIVDASIKGSYPDSLIIFNEILENGYDGHNFIAGLGSHLRDLLVSRDRSTIILLDTAPVMRKRYHEQSALCDTAFLIKALEICNSCDLSYKSSKNPRLLVELTLLKLASINMSSVTDAASEKKKPDQGTFDQPVTSGEKITAGTDTGKKTTTGGEEKTPPASVPAGTNTIKAVQEASDRPIISTAKVLSVRDIISNGISEPAPRPASTTAPAGADPAEKEPFTHEALKRAWLEYASAVRQESPRMAGLLTEASKQLSAGDNIIITLSNLALKEEFDRKYKGQLNDYICKHFDCPALIIESRVEEETKTDPSVYTDEQKFNYLASKNPVIKEMRKSLNLDFE